MGSKPDYSVYVSREVDGSNFYSPVGAAWKVAKSGISIQLNSLPIDGKLVMFPKGPMGKDPPED